MNDAASQLSLNCSTKKYPIIKVEDLAYAYGKPEGHGRFKVHDSDFIVRETLSFEPEGEGTHAYLYIEKTDTNTEWLARQLARFVGIEAKEIGYAGLKDRNAITSQWFSVKLEGIDEPNWDDFQVDGVTILKKTWHRKKLKRGSIKSNHFDIVLRDVTSVSSDLLKNRIEQIQQYGVPNYFAQQRFGHDYNNLTRGARWFAGEIKLKKRADKSMSISASRSMVFNQMLSQRLNKFGWNRLVNGDIMMLNGTHSIFSEPEINEEILKRFEAIDIHPTAALWGRGRLNCGDQLLELEQSVADLLHNWCEGLEKQGLKQERRAIRLFPGSLSYTLEDSNLSLSFSLPSGTYATAVLREIIQF